MKTSPSLEQPAMDAEKKVRSTRNSLISNTKWLRTADGSTIYSFLPRSPKNRAIKVELTAALKKKNVDVTVFSREISVKSTGEKINSYVIATNGAQFISTFPAITAKPTSVNFAPFSSDKSSSA
jgi:hypothetical protein